jgi:hypothetical protein
VEKSAASIAEAVAQAERFAGAAGRADASLAEEITDSIVRMFDLRHGGFGRAPKFPHPAALDLLLERFATFREPHLATVFDTTLEKMARGGVYDHLAGGFHRYSVDERWHVPHFEKMSYDNSELLRCYVHAFQVTRKPFFREVAEGILGWVAEVLSDGERGGYFSSQDADISLDDDGDYFTWTLEELRAACSSEEAEVAALHFGVEARGQMAHNPAKNVLRRAREADEIAPLMAREESEVRLLLASARRKMLEARARRAAPQVDRTIYTCWNAMMAGACLEAGRVLGRAEARDFALRTLGRLLEETWDEGRGFAHRAGGPRLEGTLDDQVFTAAALLDAFEATLDRRYFDGAERAMRLTMEKFRDAEFGGFFDRPGDAAPLGGLDVRRKPLQDAPTPAANSCAALVLLRLEAFTGRREYGERARETLEAFANVAPQMGLFVASYALAAHLAANPPAHVVITGAAGDATSAALEAAALAEFRLARGVMRVTPEIAAQGALPPALAETIPHLDAGKAQALVCSGMTCQAPLSDPDALRALLRAPHSPR